METVACQLDLAWESPAENLARVEDLIDANCPSPGGLFVLPELFTTGFTMDASMALAEADATLSQLAAVAADHEIHVIAGVGIPLATGDVGNFSITFGPDGKEIGRYQKLFPFSLAEEDKHYPAGDKVAVQRLGEFVAAPFVCYDLRFPEPFRAASEAGANLIVVIANWPAKRTEHWKTLLVARAIENLAFVVGVNRSGQDPFHEYAGDSMIIAPTGEVLADAGSGESCIAATLDISTAIDWRNNFPALRDRRPITSFPIDLQ